MVKLIGKIWLVYAGLIFIGFFIITYPLLLIWLSTPNLYPVAHFQRKIWGRLSSLLILFIPLVKKETTIPKNRRIIYCANHASYLDILTTGSFLPGFNFFMAKEELAKIPLFGIWFRTIDIPVQRASRSHSYKAFENASKQFDAGIDLIIFPEGKIPADNPKLSSFKAGAFRLAIQKQALIIPVTLPDNFKRFPTDKWLAFPGIMRMHIHAPIDTKGLTAENEDEVASKVYTIIANQLVAYGVPQNENRNQKS